MKDSLIRRMRDRGIIALVAFLFSIGLWYRVVGGEKIEVSKTIKLDYMLPKDLVLFSPYPTEITVRVKGPAPFVTDFIKQDVNLAVDLSKKGVGEHELRFRSDQFKIPLSDLTNISPPLIKVILDKEVKNRVAVRPLLSTQLPEGYKVDGVVVQPSMIEIKGSRRRVGLISSIPTEMIYVSENSLEQHFEVPLNIADSLGVESTEKLSTVHVEITLQGPSKKKTFKNIPILLKVGNPSKSKLVDTLQRKIKMSPKSINITVEGPEDVLDSLEPGKIDFWVQLLDLKSGVQQPKLTWKLPPEVRIINRSADFVNVTIP